MFAVFKMDLSGKTVYGSVLKTTQLSAHASIARAVKIENISVSD